MSVIEKVAIFLYTIALEEIGRLKSNFNIKVKPLIDALKKS